MARLLVITYHFPPDGAVGGLRWAGLGKYLAQQGWEVCVVTASKPTEGEFPAGVRVEFCQPRRTLNHVYRSIAERRRNRSADSATFAGVSANGASRLSRRLRVEAAALLELPDVGRGWIVRATRRTRALLRSFRPDVVVSSGPPHSAHLVAQLAMLGRSIAWYVDLRDPWAVTNPHLPLTQTHSFEAMIPRLERSTFRRSSKLITTTRELAEQYTQTYPRANVSWVPNGVDRELLPGKSSNPFEGLALASVGTLYLGRDLGPIFAAMERFLARNPAARASSKLRVAGFIEAEVGNRMSQQVAEHDLAQHVEVLGSLSRADALSLIARSQAAVVLAQDQGLQIPAKLYELVGIGVSPIVITESGSATAREGRRVGAIVLEPDDTDGIVRVFERIWRGELERNAVDPTLIDYRTIAGQLGCLLDNGSRPANR